MEKKTVGSFIAVLRKSQGMTQRELAEKLCVSDKAVSRWERDEAAPDLMLIPVIADIFGVTCDEILRGERFQTAKGSADVGGEVPQKSSEKQLRHLIGMNLTKYKKQTWIVLGIAGIGVVLCLTFFLTGYPSYGLGAGIVFSIAAAVCLGVFATGAAFSDGMEELDGESILSYKRTVYTKTFNSAMLVTASVCVDVAFWLLGVFDSVLCLIPAAAYFIVYFSASAAFYRRYAEELHMPQKKRRNSVLRLRVLVAVLSVAAVLTAGIVTAYNLPYTCFSKGKTFQTADEFKAYMRNHNYEKELWISDDGEDRNVPEGYDSKFLTTDDTEEFDCVRSREYEVGYDGEETGFWFYENDYVDSIEGSSEHLPIRVFSDEDFQRRGSILTVLNNLMIVFCAMDIIIGIAVYLKKRDR